MNRACWRAQCTDYGVTALDGLAQRLLIARVADNELCSFQLSRSSRGSDQGGDVIAAINGLADDLTSGWPGGSQNQDLWRSGETCLGDGGALESDPLVGRGASGGRPLSVLFLVTITTDPV